MSPPLGYISVPNVVIVGGSILRIGHFEADSLMYVYFKRDAGRYYTRDEFLRFVEKKTLRTIQKYDMLKYNDVIAVAVSGGKDSVALLYILDKIERSFQTELVIIHVDEGISNYSEYSTPIIYRHARELGLRVYMTSFKEMFGYTIDDVARSYFEGRIDLEPCSFCGEWRRWCLNYLALKANATVITTAHTLDDFAQTILINVMRNSIAQLFRISIGRSEEMEGFVPRVYPFAELYEKETALYTHLRDLEHNDAPCPYAELSMRWDLRMFLYEQEEKHPGILYNILRFHQNFIGYGKREPIKLRRCDICGYPTPHKICRAHQLKEMLDETTRTVP